MSATLYPTLQSFTPDGVSASFTLNNAPAADSLLVVLNGLILHPGVDFTIVGQVVTIGIVPMVGDNVIAFYTPAVRFPAPPVRTPFAGADWHAAGKEISGTAPSRGWIQWLQQITLMLSTKQ